MKQAEIGIFGGSGFYSLEGAEETEVKTPYGELSAPVSIVEIAGRKVAFMPRHGKTHDKPPHAINYQANLYAFKQLGVKRVISPCAAGSLQPGIKPGEFVVLDQLFDRTHGRKDTFYDAKPVTHISMAEPYCPELRKAAIAACKNENVPTHETGTVVVINGPRFSTKAESKFYHSQGFHAINMTQYPEASLARELEMCFCGIALITDYDAGLAGHPEVKPVNVDDVVKVFHANNEKIRRVLQKMIPLIPKGKCGCQESLKNARI